jgi:multidrug efflux pump subunit AcrA (membrane-fusion protein)
MRRESIGFDIRNEYIQAVYVQVGDAVREGDILAELDRAPIKSELERLALEEAVVWLEIAQWEDRRLLTLTSSHIGNHQADDSLYFERQEALQAQLDIIRIRRDYLQSEDDRRVLRAGLDGIVTDAVTWREGLLSVRGRNLFTVADQSVSLFTARGRGTEYMEIGGFFDIWIDGERYTAQSVDPYELNINQPVPGETYLLIVGEEPPASAERLHGNIQITLAEARDVLYLPDTAVRRVDGRVFVYVLEDGSRSIRDIETGLEGNAYTEIISGLSEGEAVIR